MICAKITYDQHQGIIATFEVPAQDTVGDSLRRVGGDDALLKPAADTVTGEDEEVAGKDGNRAGAQGGQLKADHAASEHCRFDSRSCFGVSTQQQTRDVTDGKP